jgi:hypothetical protein
MPNHRANDNNNNNKSKTSGAKPKTFQGHILFIHLLLSHCHTWYGYYFNQSHCHLSYQRKQKLSPCLKCQTLEPIIIIIKNNNNKYQMNAHLVASRGKTR